MQGMHDMHDMHLILIGEETTTQTRKNNVDEQKSALTVSICSMHELQTACFSAGTMFCYMLMCMLEEIIVEVDGLVAAH
jgi:hypothetical protein